MKKELLLTSLMLAAISLLASVGAAGAAPFAAGNLAMLRGGDGTAYTGTRPLIIDEYTSSGTLVQSINTGLSWRSNNVSPGMSLSQDGRYLTLSGLATPVNTPTSSLGSVNRVIARVDMYGNIDTSTLVAPTVGEIGAVASADGSGFWVTSYSNSKSYIDYVAYGSTGEYQPLTAGASSLYGGVNIVGGQLYADQNFIGIQRLGSGLPTSGEQSATVYWTSTTSGVYPDDFFLADPSTLYVNNNGGNGLGKYKMQADGSWKMIYQAFIGPNFINSGNVLAGSVKDGVATLYTAVGTKALVWNDTIANTDPANTSYETYFNATPAVASFRGIDLVPTVPPATPTPVPAALWLLGSGMLGLVGIRRRKSVC